MLPKRLPQKFSRQQSHAAVEFSRGAPRLLQHGRIEQQCNARDEGSFLFRRSSRACEPSAAISRRALNSEYNARSRRNCLRSSPFQFCARARAASSSREKASIASLSSLFSLLFCFLPKKAGNASCTSTIMASKISRPNRFGQFPFARRPAQNSAAVILGHIGGHKAIDDAVVHERREHVVRERASVDRKQFACACHGQILAARE